MAKVGRPKGTKKPPTVSFHRRVKPKFAIILNKVLDELKNNFNNVDLAYELLVEDKKLLIKVFTNKNI